MSRIQMNTGNWKKKEGRRLTDAERVKLVEADRLYCLEVEEQRRKGRSALSRMPRNRMLD